MLPILDAVQRAGGQASTSEIREAVADQLGLDQDTRSARSQIGGQDHNLLAHRIRWGQQHNRLAGLIERDDGNWRLTSKGYSHLTQAFPGRTITIFITLTGCALWGLAEAAARIIDHGQVRLLLKSPSQPPSTKKATGNLAGQEQG